MKKILIIALLSITSIAIAQKSKSVKKELPISKTSTSSAPKTEISNGEINIIHNNSKILVSKVIPKSEPIDLSLKGFTANGTSLHVISWTEKKVTKTDLKSENITTKYSKVFDLNTKTEVFSNTQTTNEITEKVFLDKLKGASETQTKIRREGLEFVLNPDGSITQKNKTQTFNWKYDASKTGYIKQ